MDNFEVKKHGTIAVNGWLPVQANVDKILGWHIDAGTGKLVKIATKVESNVAADTRGWALMKTARGLGVVETVGDDEYRWGKREFSESELAAKLDEEPDLYEEIREAVEALRLKEERAAAQAPKSQGPPPPPAPAFGKKQ